MNTSLPTQPNQPTQPTQPIRILLLEDDLPLRYSLVQLLEGQGWQIDSVTTLREVRQKLATTGGFDLLLFDISLPDGSALSLTREILAGKVATSKWDVSNVVSSKVEPREGRSGEGSSREGSSREGSSGKGGSGEGSTCGVEVPVFFLSAKDDEATIVEAFSLGADDYLTKPFRASELILRIKRSLERQELIPAHKLEQTGVTLGELTAYPKEARLIDKEGKEVHLSALEWKLLVIFLNHRGQVLTRDQLLDQLYDLTGELVNDNTLTVYIKRLREKIESDPKEPTLLLTLRGLGYRLRAEGE